MIGLSLSYCIKDLIEGRASEDDVEFIITGTNARNEEEWDDVIAQYSRNYWYKDEFRAVSLVGRLEVAGKIYQPRAFGQHAPNIAATHWITEPYTTEQIEDAEPEYEAENMRLINDLIETVRSIRETAQ